MTAHIETMSGSRSAAVLKSRLIDAQREEFEAGLGWALTDPAIEAAAAHIASAGRRFVLGTATSFTYASLLAAKLSNSLAQVTLVDGTIVRPLDIVSDVRVDDVLIVISLRRYRSSTIHTALPFVQSGGSLVLITDSDTNPLAGHATQTIVIGPADSAGLAHVDDDLSMHPETPEVSPPVVAMVVELLATLVAADAKGSHRRFTERQRLASELGLYHD
ncbi:SIS domain-containing protein [Aeromicrobium sp. A1-2]|uniref:SIS domain-containing protein n=1 Tax=Aeromicrobium sp. A1-2 TaxID=2107713 RepID=UPI000E469E35|nr:SIS domain-containing protein [Aeromicrobium sp. A1-2]AXT86948.1 SIS domain-containing protein [Aeromicrobium sp. A1-2]